tara:strand:- start:416 stop:877 length:462 start_codon:yes stop_codon:yes gene_type:complete
MKKLLLILLCLPLLFSCSDPLKKEITTEMQDDGYTGQGTYIFDGYRLLKISQILDGKEFVRGACVWANVIKYVGEWKDGKAHGLGTCVWANGIKYVGEWKDGKRHGQGTQDFTNGIKFVGEHKDDKRHGQGTMTWYGETIKKGLWENDEFVEE